MVQSGKLKVQAAGLLVVGFVVTVVQVLATKDVRGLVKQDVVVTVHHVLMDAAVIVVAGVPVVLDLVSEAASIHARMPVLDVLMDVAAIVSLTALLIVTHIIHRRFLVIVMGIVGRFVLLNVYPGVLVGVRVVQAGVSVLVKYTAPQLAVMAALTYAQTPVPEPVKPPVAQAVAIAAPETAYLEIA